MKKSYHVIFLLLLSVALIGCDRATKNLAKEHLQNKVPKSYFHDTVRLEYVENTGAFLSLGEELPQGVSFWLLSVLPVLFLSGLFIYAIRGYKKMSFLKTLPFILIFSGGIGNVIDRILFNRHVSDFLNVGINDLRTGIFNFADIYITTGAVLLLIVLFKKNLQETIYKQ